MKSKKSYNHISIIIKENLKRFWPLMLIVFLMLISMFTLLTLRADTKLRASESLSILLAVFLWFVALASLGIGLIIFNYMQKKGESNFMHSLPIKRKSIFFGELLSGILMVILPLILTSLLLLYSFKGDFEIVVKWFLLSALVTLHIYVITVISGFFSGNTVMHIFNAIFFNVASPIIISEINAIFGKMLFGYSGGSAYSEILINSNVISAMISNRTITVIFLYTVITAVLTLAAYILYTKRKIEKTGNSIMFGWLKLLIMGIAAFMGMILMGLIFDMNTENYGSVNMFYVGITIGFFISYSIMWILIYRNTKIFSKKSIKVMLPTFLIFILIIGCVKADVFGYSRVTVPVNNVKFSGITLFNNIQDTEFSQRFDPKLYKSFKSDSARNFNNGQYDSQDMKEFTYIPYWKSKENIEVIHKIHEIIILSKSSNQAGNSKYRVGLSIIEKNNKVLRRAYGLSSKDVKNKIEKEFAKLYESKEFKEKYKLENMNKKIESVDFYKSDEQSNETSVSKKKFESLLKAMDKDFEARTYKEQVKLFEFGESNKSYFVINIQDEEEEGDEYIKIMLSENDKNTNAWIKANVK